MSEVKRCPLCGDEMPTSWRWVSCRGCHRKYSFRAAGQDKYEDAAYREAVAAQQAKLDGAARGARPTSSRGNA